MPSEQRELCGTVYVPFYGKQVENLVLKYQEAERRKRCFPAVINGCGSVTSACVVPHGPCPPGATNNET